MVMEQVRKHKVWELPLHELQNLAPDIAWSNPPTISPASKALHGSHGVAVSGTVLILVM